ncbi:hypothetical protein [Halolamina sp. C58]|uniref:hypothetical protein n=1 Tax=Halolamina sp. C58 TaxID=3421640 RepID=UPI003EB6F7AF
MQMVKHDSATCAACGGALWFGTKSEGNGWKVYYECDDCGFERRAGRVTVDEVESRDEVRNRAEAMGEQF